MENRKEIKSYYLDMLLCLSAVTVMPIFMYGVRVVILLGVALVTSMITDFICVKIIRKSIYNRFDYSWALTAFLIVLLMPATAPPWIVVVSVCIANFIAKHPFGGEGRYIFSPSAVGVAFCTITWPDIMLKYPAPFTTFNISDPLAIQYLPSPGSILAIGGAPKLGLVEVLLGWFVGPIGATSMIVLSTCLLYLFIRKRASVITVASALGCVTIMALLFPRINGPLLDSVMFELSSGAFYFGLIFLATDYSTIPKTKSGLVLYGVIIGVSVMLYRYFGKIELEFVFVILLANVLSIPCDKYTHRIADYIKKLTQRKVNVNVIPIETSKKEDDRNA